MRMPAKKQLAEAKLDNAMLMGMAAKKMATAASGERSSLSFGSRMRSANGGRRRHSERTVHRSAIAAARRTMRARLHQLAGVRRQLEGVTITNEAGRGYTPFEFGALSRE